MLANVVCLGLLVIFNIYVFFYIMAHVIEGLPYDFLNWAKMKRETLVTDYFKCIQACFKVNK